VSLQGGGELSHKLRFTEVIEVIRMQLHEGRSKVFINEEIEARYATVRPGVNQCDRRTDGRTDELPRAQGDTLCLVRSNIGKLYCSDVGIVVQANRRAAVVVAAFTIELLSLR
jgi:hypothetical protein